MSTPSQEALDLLTELQDFITPATALDIIDEHLARAKADALDDAADHFDNYDMVTIEPVDVGSNLTPVAPADRLRARAAEVRGGVA